ncbi:hypothetical protein ACVME8_010645 [Bradyrhizobium diazoefficiens]|uniref:RiboL-PSP-HEPN domain-containing protein n=1 Tax=Bradyrhizobium barranii subsp. barranii TaxID=2823807 RepID=A0A939MF84_9BRAD|nr:MULTISPECIES: HEPN domain-containing protein [Bradyrhizobium]UEM12338.1 hypothetical protein J4G43_049370 [Bradyrhizobium barranii subsp. barranii]WLB87710.1 HEPN domain-containing protein [Bradyrhizobium japonicum USDA 135]
MINADLDKLVKRARSYIDLIDASALDPQIVTLLHRYICVLLSSNIDKSIQLILIEYARISGNGAVKRFVSKKLERGTNYQTEKVTQLLGSFDPRWAEQFEATAKQSDLKEKLDSLYGLRNSISHGEQINISRPSLDGYWDAHNRAVGLIRKIVLG